MINTCPCSSFSLSDGKEACPQFSSQISLSLTFLFWEERR